MDVKHVLAVIGEPGIQRTTAGVPRLRHALATLLAIVNEDRCKDDEKFAIAGSVAKVLPSYDLVVKRLACILLTKWHLPDVGLLVYNTLRTDCSDANPLIRSLALRTILHRNFVEFREPNSQRKLLVAGLDDTSAHVRRTAVLSCRRVRHSICPSTVDRGQDADTDADADDDDYYFIDRLYAMLRDPDPLVIVDCLSTLDRLLRIEGGVAINRGIVRHLLSRIVQLSDLGVVQVLDVLGRRYTPQSEEEKFGLMDSLDPLLQRRSSAVIYETTRLFLRLVETMRGQVFRRVATFIFELLADAAGDRNYEIQYLWLRFVRENHVEFSETALPASLSGRLLHCEYDDPVCIKVLKIEISTLLYRSDFDRHSDAARLLLDELFAHCTDDRSEIVSDCAIRSLRHLAVKCPPVNDRCVSTLVRLLASNKDRIKTTVLSSLCQLEMSQYLQECPNRLHKVLRSACNSGSKSVKIALANFLGVHGRRLESGPYFLEELMKQMVAQSRNRDCSEGDGDDNDNDHDDEKHRREAVHAQRLKEVLLVSGLRMLFARPAEMQFTFGRYAEQCYADDETGDLAKRVDFYFRLLQTDLDLAKLIICN